MTKHDNHEEYRTIKCAKITFISAEQNNQDLFLSSRSLEYTV